MRTTEMVLFAHFLKTSKFIHACISIYIIFGGHPPPFPGYTNDSDPPSLLELLLSVSV